MIVFNNANSLEVNEGVGEIIIAIDPTASGITEVTELEISTIDGTARSTDFTNNGEGLDFTALDSLRLEVDPNNSDTFTFTVNLTEDAIAEPTEDFQFRVRAVEDAALNGTGTIAILDNDSAVELESVVELVPEPETTVLGLLPSISINDVEQLEGNNGVTNFDFTLSLSEASNEVVTVDYATADGTAVGTVTSLESTDADYIADSGTVVFTPGETEQTISIDVIADTEFLAEAESETFLIDLFNQTNANLRDFRAVGTIIDDDFVEETNSTLPVIQLENSTFIEGDVADSTQQLVVNLVNNSDEAVLATEDISFTYRTVDLDAAANLDYEFIASKTAIIESGESSTTIDLTIIGDEEIELDESFTVVLADLDTELVQFDNSQSQLEAVVTIQDDDGIIESNTVEDEVIELEIENQDAEESELDNVNDDDLEEEIEETPTVAENEIEEDSTVSEEEAVSEDDSSDSENVSSGVISDDVDNDNSSDFASDFVDNTVLRFLNTEAGGYLYTASEAEIESVTSSQSDFEFETASFTGIERDTENAEDVYRFFNTRTEGYFYTASEVERDFIQDNLDEFVFEDVAFSAFETNVEDSIPVYRFFNDSTGVHFYTADETERAFVDNNLSDYGYEGIAFYALPASEMI